MIKPEELQKNLREKLQFKFVLESDGYYYLIPMHVDEIKGILPIIKAILTNQTIQWSFRKMSDFEDMLESRYNINTYFIRKFKSKYNVEYFFRTVEKHLYPDCNKIIRCVINTNHNDDLTYLGFTKTHTYDGCDYTNFKWEKYIGKNEFIDYIIDSYTDFATSGGGKLLENRIEYERVGSKVIKCK